MEGRRRIGTLVANKWRLERILGVGGTSTVYSATRIDGTQGAVKVFHKEHSERPKVLRMLLREARLVAAVEHPGTVRVLDDGMDDDGCAFIVFELLLGRSLESLRQARGGRVPLEEVM